MKKAQKQVGAKAAVRSTKAVARRGRSHLDAKVLGLRDGPRLERVRASIRSALAEAVDQSGADALTSLLLDVGVVEYSLKQSGHASRLPEPEFELSRLMSAAGHLERILEAVERGVGSDLESQPMRARHAVTPA